MVKILFINALSKTQSIMKNTLFIILLFIVISSISCEKNRLERRLDGTWVEVEPCYGPTCDTLIMSKDGDFNSKFVGEVSYVKIDDHALEITRSNGAIRDYRIDLSDDYETLKIHCLATNIWNQCQSDITFNKIE